MNKKLCSCLALGALGGAILMHPSRAMAVEPVLLTEEEMDGITAGFDTGPIVGSGTWTFDTLLSSGRTARTVTTIACPNCAASINIDPATGNAAVAINPLSGPNFGSHTIVNINTVVF